MQHRTLDLPGLEVPLAEAGAGGRPILLLHGFCGAKEDLTDWLDPLAGRGWHAVAYDQRGHGRGRHPAGEASFSLPIMAADALMVADALGWDRLALLGHSMGGMVAQLVALAGPPRLDALILMDTCHGPPEGLDQGLVELGQGIVRHGGMPALVEAMRALGPSALATEAHARVCRERPGYQEFCDAKTLAVSPEMWVAMTSAMLAEPDRLAALAGLAVPTLVMVGDTDATFLGPSRAMAAAIPGARLAVIPGAGHSPQFEAPGPWWEALSTFLREAPA